VRRLLFTFWLFLQARLPAARRYRAGARLRAAHITAAASSAGGRSVFLAVTFLSTNLAAARRRYRTLAAAGGGGWLVQGRLG